MNHKRKKLIGTWKCLSCGIISEFHEGDESIFEAEECVMCDSDLIVHNAHFMEWKAIHGSNYKILSEGYILNDKGKVLTGTQRYCSIKMLNGERKAFYEKTLIESIFNK